MEMKVEKKNKAEVVNKDLKIEIRPIPGRNGIREFSENLEFFSQAHIITAYVNGDTLKYETGLSEDDKQYLKDNGFPYDIDDTYQRGVPHPFWESEIVKTQLTSTPMFLFPGRNLLDFVKWKYLKKSNYVYSSEQEMLKGHKTEATHYIYNEAQENEVKATALEKRNKLVQTVSEMSLARKRDIILILLNENTDNKDENYLTVRFEDVFNDKEQSYRLTQLLKHSDEMITTKANVKSAIHKNVLTRTPKGIFYFEHNIGLTEDDVVEYLNKPENQEVLLQIKSKI